MPNEIILFVYFIMWYLLTIFACLYFFSGMDDLFIDIYYWIQYIVKLWIFRNAPRLTYKKLNDKEEQWLAVLTPCWHEAGVIGTMLKQNTSAIDYKNYYIFVGVYPNDPNTIAEVMEAETHSSHVKCVIGKADGPTNKAANLNGVYDYIKAFEKEKGITFEIFVFHDSEDIIHPLSFKLYNYLCPRKQMIQIPIFPLTVNLFNFTHWVYADEFSEIHTKDIIVREAIKGHVPSAGVGTAFARKALHMLEDPITKVPFSTDSLTEDYRTSLQLHLKGLKQIFVTQKIPRLEWKKKWHFFGKLVLKKSTEFIATRAMFPTEYIKAVRQKSRWIIGIVFQEAGNVVWPEKWPARFTLTHDRKALFTHLINGLGYIVFMFWILYSLITYKSPNYPSIQEQFNLHPWVWQLIVIVTLMMCQRMLQRAIAVWRVYKLWLPALLSMPRVFYANIINLHALLKAFNVYYSVPKSQKNAGGTNQPAWDKTDHHFPGSHILTPHKPRLGDILLKKALVNESDLTNAIIEHNKTGERLGTTLIRLKLVTEKQIIHALSEQYSLDLIPLSQVKEMSLLSFRKLPKRTARWLRANKVYAFDVSRSKKHMKIAIEDPTNEYLLAEIIYMVQPYKAVFMLIDPTTSTSTQIQI